MDIFEHLVYDVLFSLSMKSLVAWVEEMLYTISSPQFQKDIYWIDANTLCCVLYAKDSKFGRSLIFAHTNSVIFQQRYEVYAIIPNIKLRKLSITTTLMQKHALFLKYISLWSTNLFTKWIFNFSTGINLP